MNTRNIAALELPAKLFGKARFKPGDTIPLKRAFTAESERMNITLDEPCGIISPPGPFAYHPKTG